MLSRLNADYVCHLANPISFAASFDDSPAIRTCEHASGKLAGSAAETIYDRRGIAETLDRFLRDHLRSSAGRTLTETGR